MTLREVGEKFSDLFSDIKGWYLEGSDKLINGDFLDLTIGQAILFLILAFMILGGIFDGITSAIDNRRRFKLNMEGAKQGDASSQSSLGKMYVDGDWVAQDYVEARKWAYIAEGNGFEGGGKYVYDLEILMHPNQIVEAQKLANEWMEEH